MYEGSYDEHIRDYQRRHGYLDCRLEWMGGLSYPNANVDLAEALTPAYATGICVLTDTQPVE